MTSNSPETLIFNKRERERERERAILPTSPTNNQVEETLQEYLNQLYPTKGSKAEVREIIINKERFPNHRDRERRFLGGYFLNLRKYPNLERIEITVFKLNFRFFCHLLNYSVIMNYRESNFL